MLKVKNGDFTGMSKLFERYHICLYNYFLRMGLKRDESQDLTQNLFYRMIKYRSSYKEGNCVKTWIYSIARNLFNDYCNEQQKNKSLFNLTDNYTTDVPDDATGFVEEDYERLDFAMQSLTDEQRELLVLSRFQGLTYSDMSAIVNQSVPAIKVGVFRAINKLRSIYFKR